VWRECPRLPPSTHIQISQDRKATVQTSIRDRPRTIAFRLIEPANGKAEFSRTTDGANCFNSGKRALGDAKMVRDQPKK